nr:stealth conserved region 3 domain-containing protein [Loktanella sp. SALINAS62]
MLSKNRLQTFIPRDDIGVTGVVYTEYVHKGTLVHGVTSGVEIEFCIWSDTNQSWRAPRAGIESEADVAYLDALEEFTYLDVPLPILRNAHAIWQTHPARTKVDLVYTWVNGADTKWQARKAGISHDDTILGANSAARFDSGSELLFSVISALRYFGDLGRIYIVTDNQVPGILGDLLDRVTIVDHTQIFDDPACLPTFNSHAIGAQLHKIPGLRQHYLYLNDDVLFGRPTAASNFFDELGRSYQFHSSAVSTPHTKVGPRESAVNAAARNNRQLLLDRFGRFAFRKFKHTPIAIDRTVMEQMQKDLPEAWDRTIKNRFRSTHDHAIAGHLYAHYAAYTGRSVVGAIRYAYFDLGSDTFQSRFSAVFNREWTGLDTFCVNETLTSDHTHPNRTYMDQCFTRLYPRDEVVQRKPAAPSRPFKARLRHMIRQNLPHDLRLRLITILSWIKNR